MGSAAPRHLARIVEHLLPRGYLVIGAHERLPGDGAGLALEVSGRCIYQKGAAP